MERLDEKRIQEIVEKVMARLGGADLPSTPLEAIERAVVKTVPLPRAPAYGQPRPDEMRHKNIRVPAGKRGIFPDVDSAAKAARKAFEQYDRTPIEVRNKMIEAMRATTLAHVRELAELRGRRDRARARRRQDQEEHAGRHQDARPRDPAADHLLRATTA